MGISTNVYVYYGAKIPYSNELSEEQCNFENDDYNLKEGDLLFEGMGGTYILLGKCLFDSGDFRWGSEGTGDQEVDLYDREFLASLEDSRLKILAEFKEKYPSYFHLFENVPWKLHFFTFCR